MVTIVLLLTLAAPDPVEIKREWSHDAMHLEYCVADRAVARQAVRDRKASLRIYNRRVGHLRCNLANTKCIVKRLRRRLVNGTLTPIPRPPRLTGPCFVGAKNMRDWIEVNKVRWELEIQ